MPCSNWPRVQQVACFKDSPTLHLLQIIYTCQRQYSGSSFHNLSLGHMQIQCSFIESAHEAGEATGLHVAVIDLFAGHRRDKESRTDNTIWQQQPAGCATILMLTKLKDSTSTVVVLQGTFQGSAHAHFVLLCISPCDGIRPKTTAPTMPGISILRWTSQSLHSASCPCTHACSI